MAQAPRKILYLNSAPFVGGGEISLLETVAHVDRNRYAPLFAVPSEGEYSERIRARGLDVRVLGVKSPNTHRWANPVKTLYGVQKLIAAEKIDLVHNNSLPYLYPSVWAARGAEIPNVCHVRDLVPPSWFRLHHNLFIRRVDAILCITHRVEESFKHLGKTRVVYNGVDLHDFSRRSGVLRDKLGFNAGDFVTGIVGYILPRKGHETFIDAALKLCASKPSMKFAVIGGDPFPDRGFQTSLENRVKAAGMAGRVVFTGHMPAPEKWMADLDTLAMPSWEEPFGRVCIEAMAARVPVVACPTGGTTEIFDSGEHGLFVEPKNSDALAGALGRLADDPVLRQKLIVGGVTRVLERFDIHKTAETVMTVYDELLGA